MTVKQVNKLIELNYVIMVFTSVLQQTGLKKVHNQKSKSLSCYALYVEV
jgi:hypothetical protein